MLPLALLTLLVSVPPPGAALGPVSGVEQMPGAVGVQVDNDLPFSDRHYTSGMRVDLTFPEMTNLWMHRPLRRALAAVWPTWGPFGPPTHSQGGFSATHEMYTPYYYWRQRPQRNDRPFAARLSFAGHMSLVGDRGALTLALDGGPLGRFAFAEELQSVSHTLLSPRSPLPEGWRWQLRGVFGVGVTAQGITDIVVFEDEQARYLSLSLQSRVRAGNLRIDAEAGPKLRLGVFGRNRPLAGPPRLPSWAKGGLIAHLLERASFAFSLAALGRVVARDAYIEGVSSRDVVQAQRHWATGRLEAAWEISFRYAFVRTALVFAAPAANVETDVGQQYWSATAGLFF